VLSRDFFCFGLLADALRRLQRTNQSLGEKTFAG
jgi:hypothetical protein